VVLNANLRDGSLRQAAREQDIPMLLYETGEALRFDEVGIRVGVKGILNVMRTLEMLPASRRKKTPPEPVIARSSTWVRAPESGILHARLPLGTRVDKGDVLGTISDPFGQRENMVKAVTDGIVIGRTNIPLVNEGDALFHIACFHELEQAEQKVEAFKEEHLEQEPTADSDIYWI
jgi:predicted deacylase